MKRRVLVGHAYYGCDTGCCGHVITVEEEIAPYVWKEVDIGYNFSFSHPWNAHENFREWAANLVRDELGEEHVADLAWDNCYVIDD